MHMPLRQQVHGDDSLSSNHTRLQRCGAGGFLSLGTPDGRHTVCHKTHSQDNPSDIHETRLSDNFRRMACYEQRVVIPLSEVQSVPILWGTLVHRRYPISVFFRFIVSNDSAKKKETSANRWQRSEKNDRFRKKVKLSGRGKSRDVDKSCNVCPSILHQTESWLVQQSPAYR